MKFEENVRNKVAGLLEDLLKDPSPETFETVLGQLTRMAILGTEPPSSQRGYNYPNHGQAGRTAAPGPYDDSFSADKESFIAP